MIDSLRHMDSPWIAPGPRTDYSALNDQRATADVVVVGGGITGLTTALLLQRSGKQVVLLEADRIGGGATGGATAKLTALHGLCYADIEDNIGQEAAEYYAAANQAGLAQVAALVDELNIDCFFERQPAYTFTCDSQVVEKIHREAAAAARAGLAASFTTQTDLPLSVVGAVRVEDQAQFDPYRYCIALGQALVEAGGTIYERSRVQDVTVDEACIVETARGKVRCEYVILATLLPFLDRGGFFARTTASRSYGIAVRIHGELPGGMYISADSPTRSVRPWKEGGGIIVVGESHKVGQDDDTRQRYAALESWARHWFDVESIEHRWSAQDYLSEDGLPYIGPMPLGGEKIMVATGFNKWGLTAGTAAAVMLTDRIQGRENPWAELFSPSRMNLRAATGTLVVENLNVAKRFFGDRLQAMSAIQLAKLPAGQGAIVQHRGEKLAAYRDEDGNAVALSPICTHLGCYVQFNQAERSWDCPCHGSRFDCQGRILQGPAVKPLATRPVDLPEPEA